uniref:Uncharacterized protein n=1 Tax=Anopheles farauti TaxID=69004 RepID=A0A182Q862_9DIPT
MAGNDIFANLDNFLVNKSNDEVEFVSDTEDGITNDTFDGDCWNKISKKTNESNKTASGKTNTNRTKKSQIKLKTSAANTSNIPSKSSDAPIPETIASFTHTTVQPVTDLSQMAGVTEKMQELNNLFNSIYNTHNPAIINFLKNDFTGL